jgi:hypothetical protein
MLGFRRVGMRIEMRMRQTQMLIKKVRRRKPNDA